MGKKNSYTSIKQQLLSLWDFFSDFILGPLLFAFVIFMLFSRIQAIINYTVANPTYSFWMALEVDMQLSPLLYISFYVVFILWIISKVTKSKKETSDKKQLNSALEKISTNISDLQQAIKDLPDKIAESIKSSKNTDNESR